MNNNICTPETAARLKAAGFPQPDPAPGQVWYYASAHPYVLLSPRSDGDWFVGGLETANSVFNPKISATFAPGVADLLRALWFRFTIRFGGNGKFLVLEITSLNNPEGDVVSENENPAEALAAAWMELNEKK